LDSLAATPEATAHAIESALTTVMRATTLLDPDELVPGRLPESRARIHLTALRDLWLDLDSLPEPFAVIRHVLGADAGDCLEPLPLVDSGADAFADPTETALADVLNRHHGLGPEAGRAAWRARQPRGCGEGALGHVQRHLGRKAPPARPDDSLRLLGLREPREEADFAAALAQGLLQDGRVASAKETGLLIPDDFAYLPALAEAFARVGLPLSGLPEVAARRDPVGEFLTALLAVFEDPRAARRAGDALHLAPDALGGRNRPPHGVNPSTAANRPPPPQ